MDLSQETFDSLVEILLTPDNSLSGAELRIRTRLLGDKNGDTTTEGSNFKEYNKKPEVSDDDKKTAAKKFLNFFFANPINVSDVAKLLQPIKQDAAPTYAAAADDTPTYAAAADDTPTYAQYGNHRRNISSDKDKTRQLIQALSDNILTIDDHNKIEVIRMLESTPEMLEFIGENLVLVHSYHSRASQILTRDEKICDKSKKVVNFLKKYYTSKQIQKIVRLTDKLQNKCLSSNIPSKITSENMLEHKLYGDSDTGFSKVPDTFSEVMGGSKSRRRHRRHRKPVRKTRRGRGRGRGRTHKSKSKSKRQIRARKYKKNTYKRCK